MNDFGGHLEKLEKQRKDQKVCDDGPDCPSSGEVGIVYHVDPILQPGLELKISPNCLVLSCPKFHLYFYLFLSFAG